MLINQIITATSEVTGVPEKAILSQGRREAVADARKIVASIAYQNGMTLQAIGTALNRHHSSVLYSIGAVEALTTTDDKFRHWITEVRSRINGKKTQIMSKIKFDDGPLLWPEAYTDHFVFAEEVDMQTLDECLQGASREAGEPPYYRKDRHVITDSQMLVDELKDAAFGYELPFQHTHIPLTWAGE